MAVQVILAEVQGTLVALATRAVQAAILQVAGALRQAQGLRAAEVVEEAEVVAVAEVP